MADVEKMTLKFQDYAVEDWDAGAASFTVPLKDSDHRAILLVDNGESDKTIRVKVSRGDGPRAVLGDLKVDVEAGKLAAISFKDSMRHKVTSTGAVTVALTDTGDSVLTAGVLANIKTLLIQG